MKLKFIIRTAKLKFIIRTAKLKFIIPVSTETETKARNSNSKVEIIPVLTEIIIDHYQPLMILNDVCATEAPPVVTSQQHKWPQTINKA